MIARQTYRRQHEIGYRMRSCTGGSNGDGGECWRRAGKYLELDLTLLLRRSYALHRFHHAGLHSCGLRDS
jgi:hypothetical protein